MIFATLICTFAKLYRTGSQIYMFLRNIVPVHRVIPYQYVSSQYCTSSHIYRFMSLRNIVPVHRFICFFAIFYRFTDLYVSSQYFIGSKIYMFLRKLYQFRDLYVSSQYFIGFKLRNVASVPIIHM